MRSIKEITVHCSGTNIRSYDFAEIKHDHIKNRGWSDIGYHFLINFEGNIDIGRPVIKSGAHVKGRNSHSIGVCILGLDAFTDIQFQQLARLLETLCMLMGLNQKAIRAHYEFNENKTCPNFSLEWFKKKYIRNC